MSIRIDGTNTTANPGITGSDTDTGLQLGTDEMQFVTGGTNRATVESNGNLTIEDGNLVVASGHGIDFSATADGTGTTSSELLDDYEEGTFTPEFAGLTTAGTYTYASNSGHYTKIGDTVHVHIALPNISTTTAGSGIVLITGLPFTSANTAGSTFAIGSVMLDNFDLRSDTIYNIARMSANVTSVQIRHIRDNATDVGMDVTEKGSNSADIYLSLTYRT